LVIYEKVRWRNFNSTGDIWTEITLEANPTTLMVGKNGAGKTTLLDAMCFGLYGKPFRNVNKEELINSVNGKKCLVEVEFRVGQKKYMVRRGMKPTVFEFYVDGNLQARDAKSLDYQKVVQKVMRMDLKSFRQIAMLGSRTYVPFMRLDAKDRRTVIEDMLDLEVFSSMNKIVKQRIDDTETELSDINESIREATNNLALERRRMEIAQENEQVNLAKLTQRDAELEAKMNEVGVHRDKLQNEVADLALTVKGMGNLETKITRMRDLRRKTIDKSLTCDENISFYEDHDTCPTCYQNIAVDFKDNEVARLEKMKVSHDSNLKLLEEKLSNARKDLAEMQKTNSKIIDLNTDITVANTTINQIMRQRSEIASDIKDLEGRSLNFEGIQSDIKKWEDALAHATTLKNDSAKQIEYLKAAETILKDNGIKAKIIKQYIPIINTLINKYLAIMNFRVNFELNETFTETIKSRYRETFSYERFSEGEKLRLDLAILFTWRDIAKLRNTTATNILIMDEVLDSSLDSEGMEDFIKIIKDMASGTNTFIISHKADLSQDNFDSVLKFEKKKDFSHMKVAK
jgi:DNA repair exonuclease SbcCD ATPase subunit